MPRKKQSPEGWDRTPEAAAYRRKYLEETYVRLQAYVKPEEKEEVERLAKAEGVSITQYIRNALEMYKNK